MSTIVGVESPSDFPFAAFERLHRSICDPDPSRREKPGFGQWLGASSGVLYRFTSFAEHSDALVASLQEHGTTPEPELRFKQEKLLYSFFCEGQSSLECLYYGIYFVGSLVDPGQIDGSIDPKRVVMQKTVETFERVFPTHALTAHLRTTFDATALDDWKTARNILSHRVAPGREHHAGGPTSGNTYLVGIPPAGRSGGGVLLTHDEFVDRRTWLAGELTNVIDALDEFVSEHLAAPPEAEADTS